MKEPWLLHHFKCEETFFVVVVIFVVVVCSWLQYWRLIGTKVAMNSCPCSYVFPPSVCIALGSLYFIHISLTIPSKTYLSKNLALILFFWIWLSLHNKVLKRKCSLSVVSSCTQHTWIAHLFVTCTATG